MNTYPVSKLGLLEVIDYLKRGGDIHSKDTRGFYCYIEPFLCFATADNTSFINVDLPMCRSDLVVNVETWEALGMRDLEEEIEE